MLLLSMKLLNICAFGMSDSLLWILLSSNIDQFETSGTMADDALGGKVSGGIVTSGTMAGVELKQVKF